MHENGCGGLNIDATRVGYSDSESIDFNAKQRQQADPKEKGWRVCGKSRH